jgi:aspartyl-tRNA synthetase
MRIYLLFIAFLVIQFIKPELAYSINNLEIIDNEILVRGKTIGKIEIEEKEITISNKMKVQNFIVKIYNDKDAFVALYNVNMDLRNAKKNERIIFEASLKTELDKTTHNGSNFLEFHEKLASGSKTKEIPQLSKVIRYLRDNHYM